MNSELYYNILQKKYNILKKNLIIIEQTDEKINEFKDTIIKLDEMEQDKFKKELEISKELTTNLEDEYKRLYGFINLVQSRHRRRETMLDDYYNIVKEKMENLEVIEGYDDLDFYNKRLEDINDFFENDDKYNKYSIEKDEYLSVLKDLNEKKSDLTSTLNDFEIDLLVKLKNNIENNSVYDVLDFDNIDETINNYEKKVIDKEKEFSTYLNSYNVLVDNYIEDVQQNDYLDFINELKKEYLDLLEKKYILLLYKYINDNENKIALEIYNERLNQLKKYDLEDNSNLKEIFVIIKNYMEKEVNLSEINNNIESINDNINQLDNKLNNLKEELNKQNIKDLLKEFCIKKEYIADNNDIDDNLSFDDNSVVSDNSDDLMNDIIFISEDELRDKSDKIKDINDKIAILEKDNVVDIEKVEQIINEEVVSNNLEDNEEKNNNMERENINEEENTLIFDDEIFNDNDIVEPIKFNIDNTLVDSVQDNVNNIEKNNNEEVLTDVVYKDNAIKKIKDFNEIVNIDNILNRALSIMKSVCESII